MALLAVLTGLSTAARSEHGTFRANRAGVRVDRSAAPAAETRSPAPPPARSQPPSGASHVSTGTTPAPGGAAPALVTLPGDVLPGLGQLADLGPVAEGTPMELVIAMQPRDPVGELAAYRAIYSPTSPAYHRFMTTAEIADRFGTPPDRWSATQEWLGSGGLRLTYASPLRDVMAATGSARAVSALLHTPLHSFRAGSIDFVANTAAPAVPADLQIASVLGLNTLQRAVTTHRRTALAAAAGLLRPATELASRLLTLGGINIGGQTPRDLWGAYEAPSSNIGSGQSVAIFGAGATDQVIADLHQFETANHLPSQTPVHVTHVGAGPFTDNSGLVEWNIDTQAAAGMAPGIDRVELYFAKDLSDAHVAEMFSQWASDPAAPLQANASFGECEQTVAGDLLDKLAGSILNDPSVVALGVGTGLINELQPVADAILRKATLQGKTLFAASGDTGSSCPVIVLPVVGAGNGVLNHVVPFTLYPATSPYAVAVGGTVLYTKPTDPASRFVEYAWTFGGGGDSLFVDQPAYQHGVPGVSLPCLATVSGQLINTGKPCRGMPDVAALSGDALTNFYPIVSNGKASAGGGTSLSSPLWAGMWARAQAASTAGGNGFANETIYRLGKAHQGRDYFDVTSGLLGLPLVGNGLYTTGPGWDYVTGWGPPRLSAFIADANAGP